MLFGYFDETGIHGPDGALSALTIGGCIASLDAWQAFEIAWQKVLDTEPDVTCFHMSKFEAWKPPYNWLLENGNRDEFRHARFLDALLDAIIKHVKIYIGYTNLVFDSEVDHFEKLYVKGIVDLIMHGIKDHHTTLGEEKVHWVFAHHHDVKERRIKDYHQILDWAGERVADVSVGRPENLLPLQAADLVVYELARAYRDGRRDRYPFKRLREGAQDMRTIFRSGIVPSLSGKDIQING